MRKTELVRKTSETEVKVAVNLDGTGIANIDMDTAFCSHMITLFATHSLIDIKLKARGDLKHHVVEDTAICLGKAIKKALGDSSGIRRFGYATVPMNCSLASAAVDLSGRPYFKV
ncbi:TPA: imidazoleglycerol-phosphate dehydratase, partial [Candidatus Bathyarchaeota archaeon]|nr:imidazoleglycerol-phosphate dehydratase [Candidatus Bathyarchaeota archaeon]